MDIFEYDYDSFEYEEVEVIDDEDLGGVEDGCDGFFIKC